MEIENKTHKYNQTFLTRLHFQSAHAAVIPKPLRASMTRLFNALVKPTRNAMRNIKSIKIQECHRLLEAPKNLLSSFAFSPPLF
jgi:hypothetical protein